MNIKKSFFLSSLLIIIITIFFGIPQLLREKNTEKNQLLFDQSIAQLKEFLLTNPNSEEIGNFFQKITEKQPNLAALIFSNEKTKDIIFSKNKKYIEFSKNNNQFSIQGNNLVLFSQNLSLHSKITVAYFLIEPKNIVFICLLIAIASLLIFLCLFIFTTKKQKIGNITFDEEIESLILEEFTSNHEEKKIDSTTTKIHSKEELSSLLETNMEMALLSQLELCAITIEIRENPEIIKDIEIFLNTTLHPDITLISLDYNKFFLISLGFNLNMAMNFSENIYKQIVKITTKRPQMGIGISFPQNRKNYQDTILKESFLACEKAFLQENFPIVACKF